MLLLLSYMCYGQQVPLATVLSVNEGLSQGMVFDIIQSRDGYIWIATKDGLNRYDGYRFKIYAPDPFDPFSIAASETWHLFEDSKGRIWVFYKGGIDVLVPGASHFFHVPKSLLKGFEFSPGYIACRVAEGGDGSIWVTENFRLWRIKISGEMLAQAEKEGNASPAFEVSRIQSTNSDGQPEKFTSVYYSAARKLLVGTFSGLCNLDAATQKLTPAALAKQEVYILGVDKREHIFLSGSVAANAAAGTQKTAGPPNWIVWAVEPGKAQPYFSVPTLASFKFDDAGNLWTYQVKELTKWKTERFTKGGNPEFEWTTSEAIANSPYFDFGVICIDRSGIIWIGTNGYGLRKIVPQQPKFSSYLPLISQRRIFEDPTGLLICAERPALAFTSKNFSRFIKNPWLKDPSFLTQGVLVFDENGNAWINKQGEELMRVEKQTGAVGRFPWKAFGLVMDRKQVLFGINTSELMAFDTKTGQSKQFPFDEPQRLQASFWQHYVHLSPSGVIWIFGLEGLIKAAPSDSGYRFTYYRNKPNDRTSLSNDFVCDVADDPVEPETYLWVGTKGGGLNRLNIKTGKFIHYRTAEGLPDNVVYGILSENTSSAKGGRLWMSTNKGLSRFDIGAGKFTNFTVADGLQSNEFNLGSYLKTRDGHLVFGGVNGLTVFHPDSLSFNPNTPQTRIVGIEVNNRPIEVNGTSMLRLAYHQNFLTLSFSALEFTNPGQNQYRYQLISKKLFGNGEEENWNNLGAENTVSLTGLPPGHYTFKVLGSNNDGNWSQSPAVLEFVIQPPWWATWWAYLLYLLGALAIVVLVYRNKLRQNLQQQEARRLRELDAFKSRFFTNISHEFRTPLTVILGATEQLGELKDVSEVKEKAGLIRRSSQNLLRLINQLLDLAKLESSTLTLNYVQGDVLPYLRYIAESLHSLANAQNVLLRVESPEKQIVMDYDPERLMQIVYNLLSNAIKFTPSGGQVILKAALEASRFDLSVTDNGAGIPAADLPHIFDRFYQAKNLEKAKAGGTGIGLALTRELVQLLGGHITVQSEEGRETTFSISLPVHRQASVAALPAPAEREGTAGKVEDAPAENKADLPTLLIVEDNPDVVDFLTACLKPFYHIEYAFNGRAGIEKAIETIPDIVVSDVMMPEKDGFEVCRTLKEEERTSHIPLVLLTARVGVENRIAGLRHGADAYLAKPFHQEELLATLENLLELRRKLQARYRNMDWKQPAPEKELPPAGKPDMEDAFLQKVASQLEAHLDDANFSVPELAGKMGLSQSQLYRKIKALTDLSTAVFIRRYRLQKGKQLLQTTELTMAEIAYQVGFTTPNYFSDAFFEEFGVRPNAMRK